MKKFNDIDFLLQNDYSKKLYHQVAAALPIIDPHNHIETATLATNKKFDNIYQLWVQNDPYKHRAMRIYGIEEALITGARSDYDKFLAWATCFQSTMGNPLFHWSCMELKTLFGIDEILVPNNANAIWHSANELLKGDGFGALDIVKKFNVELLSTSDELLDSLEYHIDLKNQQSTVACLPSLRSDSIISFNKSYPDWLLNLERITSIKVTSLSDYKKAICNRLDFFDRNGCLLSDHSLDSGFQFLIVKESEADEIYTAFLKQQLISAYDTIRLQSYLLYFLASEYAKRKWKMQLHIGANRYTSTVLRNKVGPAGGYASIGNVTNVASLCTFLDELDKENCLPKTILYTLNPADNAVFASLTGSFSEDGVQAKIQFGPAWWYNDHYDGIHQQLSALSSYGLLATAIGMTTDSRSILSFSRHNYYRRILCNIIGGWVEEGKLPEDWELISTMVKNISYYNIKKWIQK